MKLLKPDEQTMRRIEQENGLSTQTEFTLVSFTAIGTFFMHIWLHGTAAYGVTEATAVESWENNTENGSNDIWHYC